MCKKEHFPHVIPTKAGIQYEISGFPIGSGMTVLSNNTRFYAQFRTVPNNFPKDR